MSVDPTGPIAGRFPLVARPRPACLPLTDRVQRIVGLADTAAEQCSTTSATACFNLAALVASDCGRSDLAAQWARRLARLNLPQDPKDGQQATHGLEPIVNLARLRIRAGDSHSAWATLHALHQAVLTGTDTLVEGITIPAARLSRTPHIHNALRTWSWTVLLADGGRALAAQGRWQEAHEKLRRYKGIGNRMLDGRQIAVIAHLTADQQSQALRLIDETHPGTHHEQAVTTALRTLCNPASRVAKESAISTYLRLDPAEAGSTVFTTRLGLTLIDALGAPQEPALRLVTARLIANGHQDGYAARDILASTIHLTPDQKHELTEVVKVCMLNTAEFPTRLLTQINGALDTAEQVITSSSN